MDHFRCGDPGQNSGAWNIIAAAGDSQWVIFDDLGWGRALPVNPMTGNIKPCQVPRKTQL
jgi:hypothetical protein